MRDFRKNSVFILMVLGIGFVQHSFSSLRTLLFGRKSWNPKHTYPLIDFLLRSGPIWFYRFPTGIRAGRSLASFFLLLFSKDAFIFDKKSPPKP